MARGGMRASFVAFASLLLFACSACSGSSSSDVLAPAPAASSTVDKNDPAPPPSPAQPSDPDEPEDVPPTAPPKDDDPPPNTKPPTSGPPASAADCDSFAAKYCAKADTCNALVSKLLDADCTDRVATMCKAHIAAPGTGFTTAALTTCAGIYGAGTACEDAFGAAQLTACDIKGSLPLNAACAFADQCASGHCMGTANNTCGTCATRPPMATNAYAGPGEACDIGGAGAQCNAALGLWCDPGTKQCEEIGLAGLGQGCGLIGDDLVLCGPGGTCAWGGGGSGTCVVPKAIGASCTAASGYEECAFGSVCLAGKCAVPTAAAICK